MRITMTDLEIPILADAAEISSVAQASFLDAFAAVAYPPADLAAFLESAMGAATYARQIADPGYGFRIARNAAGAITGLAKTGPNDLPMPAGEPPLGLTRELHQLYLLPEAKGTGIADAMMAWVEEEARARGAVALYLSVYINNLRAQRFYARHGYGEIGKNPFQVGSVVDDDRVWKKAL
jgi:diamine N-acetyltransferase